MPKVVKILAWILGVLIGLMLLAVFISVLVYPYEYVRRVFVWGQSDVSDYIENFPSRVLTAPTETFLFEESPDEELVASRFEQILGVEDFETFLEDENTQAFIVIQDDVIIYEKYFQDTRRDSLLTSFSVAKSFTSALIGIAIEEGYINSVEDVITDYLPELAERDPRFSEITIRHLLMMASGLDYQEMRWALVNGDDPLTTYYPDQRQAALEFTQVVDRPGEYFLYNKYHPQLLGLILERTTGRSVTEYMQQKIWDPLGMEFDGSMSLDSEATGFEKMESGVNARAIDYAKFGRLYLMDGQWGGEQVIPAEWITESTTVDQASQTSAYYHNDFGQLIYDVLNGYYKYMWYGFFREGSEPDFAAAGDRGQLIYVSPSRNLIIVRNATAYGGANTGKWLDLFYLFTSES